MSFEDGSEAFRLRQEVREQFSEDFEDEEPCVEEIMHGEVKSPSASVGAFFDFGVHQLVGHGNKTSGKCGTFRKVMGCSQGHLHNTVVFDKDKGLVNFAGKGYFKPVFHSCDKPSCPVCYERGWAVREAGNIDFRLAESAKRFGLVEHIIVGMPSRFWGLSEEALREKCFEALRSRGIVGGALLFHGARYNSPLEASQKGVVAGWYWSPHFHVLGFILGGLGKCRGCFKRTGRPCRKGCGGFVDRNFRLNEKDGIYVKVLGKRKSVFGTAWYQLHHSTIKKNVERARVVTWFGICSYRKLVLTEELRKEYDALHRPKCPICGSDLVRHEYCGHSLDVIGWFKMCRGVRESVKGIFDSLHDWVENPERGSGSYG